MVRGAVLARLDAMHVAGATLRSPAGPVARPRDRRPLFQRRRGPPRPATPRDRSRTPRTRPASSSLPDPGRGRRQPEPVGRQRRAARHRRGLRCVADGARSGRRRVLARPRGVGPVARRAGRPLRAQVDAHPWHPAVDPGMPGCRLRPDHRSPDRRADRRRHLGRHGLPDDARADRRPVVRPGPDAIDRTVVGAWWGDRRSGTAGLRLPPRTIRMGIGVPGHAAPCGRRARDGPPLRAKPCQRDDRTGRQPGRHPVGGPGRRRDPGINFAPVPNEGMLALALFIIASSPASPSSSASNALRVRCTTCTSRPGASSGSPPQPGSSSSGR